MNNLSLSGEESQMEPIFYPLNVSSRKKPPHTKFSEFIRYMNLACNILIFIILIIIVITILSVLSDAVYIMKSAKTTLTDLNLIIPEIKNTLGMLTRLCNHPNFRSYCGISNYTLSLF